VKTDLAQALIDAVKAEDAEATADAFDALYTHCSMGGDEEEEESEPSSKDKSALVIALGGKKGA
jgi:hypothetical protein